MFLNRLLSVGSSRTNSFLAATPENPRFNLNDPAAWDALEAKPSYTGLSVNPETALTWSAWWRGVTLLAKFIAKCPLHIRLISDPDAEYGSTPAREHPAYPLLRWQPNEFQTAFQFKLAIAGHAINRGNGYAYIWREGPDPIELTLLDPDRTEPFRASDGSLWYLTKTMTEERRIPAADMLHIRGFGFDGMRGYPLWQTAKQCISLGLSSEKFKATRFKNGARPGVVLETPNKLDPKAVTRLREDWERMHAGLDAAHKTAILDNGLKASTLTFTAEQMQEVENAGLLLRDAANFLGVPSSKLGDVAGVKYASKEQDDQNFLDDGLDYWFCTIEAECRDKLLLESEKDSDSHIVEFHRESLIRANIEAQANYYRTATGGRGWMSPNEVRDMVRMEPSDEPDANKILTPLNMGQGGADNKPGNPPVKQSKPAPEEPPADNSAELRAAAQTALTDVARRMAVRIGHHAQRAAKESKKFGAWLETFEHDSREMLEETFFPARQMFLAAHKLRPDAAGYDCAGWLLTYLAAGYNKLADTATPKTLPLAVAELSAVFEGEAPKSLWAALVLEEKNR